MKNNLWKKMALVIAIAVSSVSSPIWAEEEENSEEGSGISSVGKFVAGGGALASAVGALLKKNQDDDLDDCRETNANTNDGLVCTNEAKLADKVDQAQKITAGGLIGTGVGGLMVVTGEALSFAGYNETRTILDRHFNALSYTAGGKHLMHFAYRSPDIPGLVLSYSGTEGVFLSKEWEF